MVVWECIHFWFSMSVTACVTVTVWERVHVRRADAETDSWRLTAGSSWTASPVTQTQSRPSAPARRKSPALIQTGIGVRTEQNRNKGGRQFPRIKKKLNTNAMFIQAPVLKFQG